MLGPAALQPLAQLVEQPGTGVRAAAGELRDLLAQARGVEERRSSAVAMAIRASGEPSRHGVAPCS